MQGNPKLIDMLNDLLASELAAINQYIVHAEMCEDWGYTKLSAVSKTRSIAEMRHAEKLIERILFLEGTPVVTKLDTINIGGAVPEQLSFDHEAEAGAIKLYNEAIVLAGEVNDYATRDILVQILNDEDAHIDEIEELQDQVDQMTLNIFLTTQV
ncbi:MAG: bacterioferritin [Raoultibacter sp.]|jgi:bacterioferritin